MISFMIPFRVSHPMEVYVIDFLKIFHTATISPKTLNPKNPLL